MNLFHQELSDSVSDGYGLIDGIIEGVIKAYNSDARNHIVKHRVEASRPDLCGVIDPRLYATAISYQAYGMKQSEVLNELKR
jgi:hypothetical protein